MQSRWTEQKQPAAKNRGPGTHAAGPYLFGFLPIAFLSFEASRDASVTHICYTLVDYTMRKTLCTEFSGEEVQR